MIQGLGMSWWDKSKGGDAACLSENPRDSSSCDLALSFELEKSNKRSAGAETIRTWSA